MQGEKNAPCEEKLEKSTCHFFNFYFISVMRFFRQKWDHSIILGRYLPYRKSGKLTLGRTISENSHKGPIRYVKGFSHISF